MPTPSRLSSSSTKCPASASLTNASAVATRGAGAGEADAGERPQAVFVEVGELVEGVVAAAMGVAGAGVEVPELAERGAPADSGTEGGHHVGQGSDGLLSEQGDDGVGGELGWSHCGSITDYRFRNDATIPS